MLDQFEGLTSSPGNPLGSLNLRKGRGGTVFKCPIHVCDPMVSFFVKGKISNCYLLYTLTKVENLKAIDFRHLYSTRKN